MRRFTILGVMGLVLAMAVGLAALRGADEYWAGGLLAVTPLLFGLALIGAICGRSGKRPGRVGFVVLGGGYFALVFLGLSDANLGKLPTSRLFAYLHERVAGTVTLSYLLAPSVPVLGYQTGQVLYDVAGAVPAPSPYQFPGAAPTVSPYVVPGTVLPYSSVAVVPGSTNPAYEIAFAPEDPTTPGFFSWRTVLPGAANLDAFATVGHCLCALLLGVIGARAGRRHAASRAREDAGASRASVGQE
jgi:hypothetical protein